MIEVEVWLYGPLAKYGGAENKGSYAQLRRTVPVATRMVDLIASLGMPLEEKGITFINGQLTDMPGLAADLGRELNQGDRIGIFHRQSMWPFQYRFGANISAQLKQAMLRRDDGAIHHSPPAH